MSAGRDTDSNTDSQDDLSQQRRAKLEALREQGPDRAVVQALCARGLPLDVTWKRAVNPTRSVRTGRGGVAGHPDMSDPPSRATPSLEFASGIVAL